VNTVFLSIGSFHIYWYGVLYVVAFWAAWFFLPFLGKMRGLLLSRDQWTTIVAWGAIGVLVGGRIGYALFYQPMFFISHPLELLAIWNGGMSSHGGFIGVAVAVWAWARLERGATFLSTLDIITVPAAIGLALGRFGNFINQEIYTGYSAFLDVGAMILIAGVCYAMLRISVGSSLLPFWERVRVRGVHRDIFPLIRPSHKGSGHLLPEREKGAARGSVIAVFLILYSISRFYLETIRVPEWPELFGLTRGQLLTIPLFIIAMILLKNAYQHRISKTI